MLNRARSSKPYVLLTGATGQVGSHLLADLLKARVPTAVLVRGSSRAAAAERIEQQLAVFESVAKRSLPRPHVLCGDINSEQLGLTGDDAVWVRQSVGSVLHSAASLSFRPASENEDNEPFRTNVDGLKNLITFGQAAGIEQWHLISTAYVCGLRDGRVLEADIDLGQDVANDYERSKIQGEQIARAMIPADQLTVYRPSIVVDTAVPNVRSDRTVYHTLALYKRLATVIPRPQPGELPQLLALGGHERKNLVEASFVSRVTVEALRRPACHGRTYHLTSAAGASIEDLDAAFLRAVDQSDGWPVQKTVDLQSGFLDGIASTFLTTFAPYFRDDPTFDRANTLDVLARAGLDDHPQWDAATVERFALGQLQDPPAPTVTAPAIVPLNRLTSASRSDLTSVGLLVSGSGGGDFVYDAETGLLSLGNGELADARLYTHAHAVRRLLDGVLSLDALTTLPAGTLEYDDVDLDRDAVEERLAALFRDLGQLNVPMASDVREVTHV